MANLRRIGLFSTPLRAAFAFVFLIFSIVQPSLFAMSGTKGVGHGLAMQMAMSQSSGSAHDHSAAAGGHEHGDRDIHPGQSQEDGHPKDHDSASAGKNCQVHCAPAHVMPVGCPELTHAASRCFAVVVADTMPRGEYTVHIRPPRHLI